ncbi:hypothetical protein COU60_05175 [Candidatus Pacearchaeota archaeon CG10_big_fil_rev_8_21_14_0_10_34_76]|nr:MAG: hypothetical protein COU60_05175 [Candidatus Pacearchaeota archaeon CG10_big_fil_rev_8_21_14_0_10_34_76]
MANRELLKFIRKARNEGFDDFEIKEPLLRKGWPLDIIEEAFVYLRPKIKFKNKISIYIDSEVLEGIDKRARKNLLTIPEQIEDILRRSVVNSKRVGTFKGEKLDDSLIGIFSRRQRKTLRKAKSKRKRKS